MRWLKLCEYTLTTDRTTWKEDFCGHFREYVVTGWKTTVDAINDDRIDRIATLNPCIYCQLCVKTPHAPECFYGIGSERISRNCAVGPMGVPYLCGVNIGDPTYPLLDKDWRRNGPLQPNAVEYVEAADVGFSLVAVQNVATIGNRVVRECGGEVRYAARCVQEIEMRKLEPQAQSAMTLLHDHPILRDQIVQLHTIGAPPCFRGQPPGGPRPCGLPYDESKTVEMVEKIWKDVRQGRVLVITPHVAGKEAPIIATPTTTVQKKLPDRTMSDDFRIISDLRLPNLFCEKDDYREVKKADIRQIAERAVAMKLKWPNLKILRSKRDIDAAFRRVKVHADMIDILRTEFSATKLGIEDNEATVMFLYLTLPFGWRASPSYFSQIGEGITIAHHPFISQGENRDGADFPSSLLFADDAIFAEPDLGRRKEMAISFWDHICRNCWEERRLTMKKWN